MSKPRKALNQSNFSKFEHVFESIIGLDDKPYEARIYLDTFPDYTINTLQNRFSEAWLYARMHHPNRDAYELLRVRTKCKIRLDRQRGYYILLVIEGTNEFHRRVAVARGTLADPTEITIKDAVMQPANLPAATKELSVATPKTKEPTLIPTTQLKTVETTETKLSNLVNDIMGFMDDPARESFVRDAVGVPNLQATMVKLLQGQKVILTVKESKVIIVKED